MSLTLTESYGADIANGTFLTIPDDGAWHEIIASAVGGNYLQLQYRFPRDNGAVISVGIGASGSEVAIVDQMTSFNFISTLYTLSLPVQIPSGARVSLKADTDKSPVETVAISFSSYIDSTNTATFTNLDLIGSADVTPPDSNGTKSAWVELSPSVAQSYKSIIFSNIHLVNETFKLFDIATGALGSEIAVIEDAFSSGDDLANYVYPRDILPVGVSIPSGTRVSCRVSGSTTDTSRLRVWGLR